MSLSSEEQDNLYIIDSESQAEVQRLLDQDRMSTREMGGLFPERDDLEGISRILDIGCGPGGWVQEVAFAYPDIEVVGIDISRASIAYAKMRSKVQSLENAQFEVMDATGKLDFPDASFDLVNARYIYGFMSPANWPALLAEARRILRPGGILRLTEPEWDLVNTPAVAQLCAYSNRSMSLAGRSFSPGGHNMGIIHMLPKFFRDANFEQIQKKAHAFEFSAGTPGQHDYFKDLQKAFVLLQPFVVKMGVAKQEELDRLYEQALAEMLSDDFCAMWMVLTVWGRKPLE